MATVTVLLDTSVDADYSSAIADKTSSMRAVMDKEMETLEKWSAREGTNHERLDAGRSR